MNINGMGTGYPAWREIEKTQKNGVGNGFTSKITDAVENVASGGDNSRVSGQASMLDTYRASTASVAYNIKTVYEPYEFGNHRILPDNETTQPLTEEVTKCSYPTDDLEKKHWYIISYDKDGIRCNEAYKEDGEWVNRHCWSISFTKPGQYEKVGAFLQRFPLDANLRFVADEDFWQDFLAGKIDEDAFVESFETSTNDGADEEESRIITKPDGSIVLQIKTNLCVMEIEVAKAQESGLYVKVEESQVVNNNIAE